MDNWEKNRNLKCNKKQVMRNLLLILMLLSSSCIHKEDKEFKSVFFTNICLIDKVYRLEDSLAKNNLSPRVEDTVLYNKILPAVMFNGLVSEIEFIPLNLEGGGYMANIESLNQFDSLINKWLVWYEENKHNMTLKKADSIYFEGFGAFLKAEELINKHGFPKYILGTSDPDAFLEYMNFKEDSLKREFRKNFK